MHLTVVIATWNRAALLAETLASMAALRVPDGVTWDILVCDNNSSDNTRQVVEDAKAARPLLSQPGFSGVTYLFEPRQGKSHALNHLLGEARGEWVLFLDDDVLVDPQWMEAYARAIAKYVDAGVLGGAILPRVTGPLTARQAMLLAQYPGAIGARPVERDVPIQGPHLAPAGANMAARRDLAVRVGFDADRGMFPGRREASEDVVFAERIMALGAAGWLVAGARVLHHTPASIWRLSHLWRWQSAIGRGWARERGRPAAGRWGVAWWAWRRMAGRLVGIVAAWRPWPRPGFYRAWVEAAQYWGYVRS